MEENKKKEVWARVSDNQIHKVYICEEHGDDIYVEDWSLTYPVHYTIKRDWIIGEKSPVDLLKDRESEISSLNNKLKELKNKEVCYVCHDKISDKLPKIDMHGNHYCPSCYENKCKRELLESENLELKNQLKDFEILYTGIKEGQVDMSVRGTTLKLIAECFIQAFIQNGGTNFFIYDLKDDNNNKYSVTIQKVDGKTPAEMLHGYKEEIDNLRSKLQDIYAKSQESSDENCPICNYKLRDCQCIFSGSAHPDRSKRIDVIKDHLYLLSPKQLKHLIELEEFWHTSYSDPEKTAIYNELKRKGKKYE